MFTYRDSVMRNNIAGDFELKFMENKYQAIFHECDVCKQKIVLLRIKARRYHCNEI